MGTGVATQDDAGDHDRPDLRPGWWPSPWPAASVAAGKIGRTGLEVSGDAVFWTESRPAEGGRQVVVRAGPGGQRDDVSPEQASVRSRVHEYGGAAATVEAGTLDYVDQGSQQWFKVAIEARRRPAPANDPVPLTSVVPGAPMATRYADGRVSAAGHWLVCVAEDHAEDGRTLHRLAAVAVDGSTNVVTLAADADFFAAPVPSPDGRWLAWISWNHPSMPWDSSELWLATLHESAHGVRIAEPHCVAGGAGRSVGQPHWCGDGSLLFADDRTGWWLPYRLVPGAPRPAGAASPLVELAADFHGPDWVLGQSTLAELADGSLVCRVCTGGRDELVRLHPPGPGRGGSWRPETVDQPCVSLSGVAVAAGVDGPGSVYVLGSTPTEAHVVLELAPDRPGHVWRVSAGVPLDVAIGDVSVGRPHSVPSPEGPVPGLFFAPVNASVPGAGHDGPPPLVVFCHGGPTGSAEPGFDPVVQFFTSRGLAVAAVDYRGSSGYGRAHRRRLDGLWGEADVDDCVDFALALAHAGMVDGSRMAIRGTSAGGLTALGALVRADCFAGAASWYGVTDLESLVADTHDFESRYLDSLVGPWPEAARTYRARSPLHHPDQISGQVLLVQGRDDPVVPADQSERFAARLEEAGVPCRLVVFEGEAHGFRRAETVEAALEAELAFYRDLFGPATHPEPEARGR